MVNLKKQRHDIGFIEIKTIANRPLTEKSFCLLVTDSLSKKVVSTFGPFAALPEVYDFAAIHNVTME